jgi:hypothetical protein
MNLQGNFGLSFILVSYFNNIQLYLIRSYCYILFLKIADFYSIFKQPNFQSKHV